MKYEMEVTTHRMPLRVRKGPGLAYEVIATVPRGTVIICTECKNGWYKHGDGWSSGEYLTMKKDLSGGGSDPAKTSNATDTPPTPPPPPMSKEEEFLYNSIFNKYDTTTTIIDTPRYLFGAPSQFTDITDNRISGSKLGRAYATTMISDMSMLTITPGKAKFMKGFGKSMKDKIGNTLSGMARDNEDGDGKKWLNDLMNGKDTGRYYSFNLDYSEYIKYVDAMCRLSAIYLGIGDMEFCGTKLKHFSWDLDNLKDETRLFKMLSGYKSVTFYIDGKQSSASESLSNSTDNSMVAGMLGKGSDFSKEALFLFGKPMSDESLLKTSSINFESAVKKVMGKLTKDEGAISRFADRAGNSLLTIANGGNIAFPEIYKDSSYNHNINVDFRFVSPYGDVKSIYLYTLVPLFHIIAFTFPRQLGANGYVNPFLVRAFCKGWFNCSLGIVESISIKKAAQDGWSASGLPTEIDVSISIKDLYETMSISRAGDASMFGNINFIDMISTMSGINVNKPEIARQIDSYMAYMYNKVTDLPNTFMNDMNDYLNNKISDVYSLFMKSS